MFLSTCPNLSPHAHVQVFCGRYVNEHMVVHQETCGHKIALSLADMSVWCYLCDSYLDNHVSINWIYTVTGICSNNLDLVGGGGGGGGVGRRNVVNNSLFLSTSTFKLGLVWLVDVFFYHFRVQSVPTT